MEYAIPEGLSAETVGREALNQWRCREEPIRTTATLYYDTFDWAIHGAGGVVAYEDGVLRWTSAEHPVSCTQPLPEAPGLIQDLPEGPVKARIFDLAPLRRLLPLVRITTRTRRLSVLDENEKTVVRLSIDSYAFRDPASGTEGRLPDRVRVEPIRGYDDERDMLLALLEAKLRLPNPSCSVFLEALAALGRAPGGYSAKLDLELDPEQRADLMTKKVLLALLAVIEANLEGAREGWDTELLHDLRVATRRTRSVLTQVKGVFPRDVVDRFKDGFARLQQLTGPVRDLDVYLLSFGDYEASLPRALLPGLAPLRDLLAGHRQREQAAMAEAMGRAELRALLDDWRAFLSEAPPARPEAPAASRPIKGVLDERIRRLAKRARREGRAISDDSPPEALHELRKTCKKLRYLIELFKGLYPDQAVKPLIKQLKVLLDELGAFQDLAVQAAHLEGIAERLSTDGEAGTDVLLAMGALIGSLLGRQESARARFEEVFSGFDDPQQWEQYRKLFWG